MKQLLTLILSLIGLVVSGQSNWKELYTSPELKCYYNTDRTTKDESTITTWVKSVMFGSTLTEMKSGFRKGYPKKATMIQKLAHVIEKREYDCDGQRYRTRLIIAYTTGGDQIFSITMDEFEAEWQEVIPDSRGETILKALCAEVG